MRSSPSRPEQGNPPRQGNHKGLPLRWTIWLVKRLCSIFRSPTESLVVLCTRGRKGDCLVGVKGMGYRHGQGRAAIKAPTPHPLLSRLYAKPYSKPIREGERTDIWQEMSWCRAR